MGLYARNLIKCKLIANSPAQALESGTAFPILDKPFYGSKCWGGKND